MESTGIEGSYTLKICLHFTNGVKVVSIKSVLLQYHHIQLCLNELQTPIFFRCGTLKDESFSISLFSLGKNWKDSNFSKLLVSTRPVSTSSVQSTLILSEMYHNKLNFLFMYVSNIKLRLLLCYFLFVSSHL